MKDFMQAVAIIIGAVAAFVIVKLMYIVGVLAIFAGFIAIILNFFGYFDKPSIEEQIVEVDKIIEACYYSQDRAIKELNCKKLERILKRDK